MPEGLSILSICSRAMVPIPRVNSGALAIPSPAALRLGVKRGETLWFPLVQPRLKNVEWHATIAQHLIVELGQ